MHSFLRQLGGTTPAVIHRLDDFDVVVDEEGSAFAASDDGLAIEGAPTLGRPHVRASAILRNPRLGVSSYIDSNVRRTSGGR
jgi:hypothetical protein